MRWMRSAVGAAALAAALATTGDVLAGKPGGGGGGSAPPPVGRIFFQDNSTLSSYPQTAVVMAMDGSGANRTMLTTTGRLVRPSRSLHGGRRWLLAHEFVPDEGRYDAYAVREDGAVRVRLTGDPLMEYLAGYDWAPDENDSGATIGMLARRWTDTTRTQLVPGSWGFYTAHLSFDSEGNVVGLDAEPTYRVDLGTAIVGGYARPDAWFNWSWAPDMSRLAVRSYTSAPPQLRVVDVATGAVTSLGEGIDPDWSPDGSKIAYARSVPGNPSIKDAYAIETTRPDGSGRTTLVSVRTRVSASTSQWVSCPKWAPDGAYLAYRYELDDSLAVTWTQSIYRVQANGSGVTNLTPEVTPSGGLGPTYGLGLVDWR